MERIIIVNRSSKSKEEIKLRFRLRDTHGVDLYHRSMISAALEDLSKFDNDGSIKKKVYVYNEDLYDQIQDEIGIMKEAYKRMKNEGLDLVSENLEKVIYQIKNPEKPKETMFQLSDALLNYIENHKGIFSNIRYKQFHVLHKQLVRFLVINRKRMITPQQFLPKDILAFSLFLFDEYQYVEDWPQLYNDMSKANIPKKKRSQTTVASTLKRLKAFFQQLEDEELIVKSPFKKLSSGDKKGLLKEEEGAKIDLELSDIKTIKNTKVPAYLQEVKDAFLLQCYIGCRIGDYVVMSMDNVEMDENGIPYLHYLPKKEKKMQKSIDAPLVPSAMKIIEKYQFSFKILRNINGKDGYNKRIKELIKTCGIDNKKDDHLTGSRRQLYEMACSKSARKTYLTLQVAHQRDPYILGLHKRGSSAVYNYIDFPMKYKYKLVCEMFDEDDSLVTKAKKTA